MLVSPDELANLEEAVLATLRGGDAGLEVLGHGEISLVLGCPSDAPTAVAKRLPPFGDHRRAEQYGELVQEYMELLAERGIHCVDTEYHLCGSGRGWAAYVVQPLVPADAIGPAAVRTRDADDPSGAGVRELLELIVDNIAGATDERVGVDGQLSNWAIVPDGLRYFDVTTPLLTDEHLRTRLDLDVLTSTLPAVLRPAVKRFVAPAIVAQYHSVRGVLLDLAANLHKERLSKWVGAVVVAANRHLEEPITPEEAEHHYARDARTWELMLRLRMTDRWWHRHVRRRPYPALLPPPIDR